MRKYKLLMLLTFAMTSLSICAEPLPTVKFITPSIVRIQWSPTGIMFDNATGVCVYTAEDVRVKCKETSSSVTYRSSELIVNIDKASGALSYVDPRTGAVLLAERQAHPREWRTVVQENVTYDEATARTSNTANGMVTTMEAIGRDTVGSTTFFRTNFTIPGGRALYGLGCQMEDYMNLLGHTVYLTQHNLKVMVPVLMSPDGFGLLFDAGCAMKYSSSLPATADGDATFSMELDAARELDYYFIKGSRMEDLVAGYRYLTGAVSLMPRYLFGYTQSKERYSSSDELISIVREYRRRHVPLDMIVQDWSYWPEGWGYLKLDSRYYPDPKALADTLHGLNSRIMISIWPNPQGCPQEADFRQRGYMLPGSVYDAFNSKAREHYWTWVNSELFSHGFDAWWCDSSEPIDCDWNGDHALGKDYGWDSQEQRWFLNKQGLADALGLERSSLYSLYHSRGIYENQRKACDTKRVVNLTRSSYAGQQRYGTIVWNGDTHAGWKSFADQIPAGLNYMATGNPYWTMDVGSFFVVNDHHRWFYVGEFPGGVSDDGYKEYYTRMFQWGTFLPMLRSHGTNTPREIWRFGDPGTLYYDAILDMINLRYSLIPYIYSLAAEQSAGGYSIARMLAFDWSADGEVLDIKDQYMFGDFLVCPVTTPMSESRTRHLRLPSGTCWTDWWTGKRYEGGQWLDVPLTLGRLPLYVRSGAIVATTAPADHTAAQRCDTITVRVYPGTDGMFSLYEDAGDGYAYERGECARIAMQWNDRHRRFAIGRREGAFDGMLEQRVFVVEMPDGNSRTITYDGTPVAVKF